MNHLRVGVALYNSGQYLAAHEPLETLWLAAPAGDRDDCLQGLIQATAAVYKSRVGNPSGATGLAESARRYINDCAEIDTESLGTWLERLAVEPDLGARERPPKLAFDGETVDLYGLSPREIIAAVEAVAEVESDDVLKRAAEYIEADLKGDRETSPYVTLTLDYIARSNPTIERRLREHVERRHLRESDVEGLFK